jgi:hypothetical protein
MTAGAPRAREIAASAAQYALLGGFTAVAAGISAQGLTGFARVNMGLRGPWPYLLFLALDGAAGVCAVLLTRRAARAESGLAPRLAVWGLVAASATFNFTHAPHRPAAPEAFGLMPVIAAVLFEFTLRELRVRTAGRADRKLTALRWLRPAEYFRVEWRLAADGQITAEAATRGVRTDQAARRLYTLRLALDSPQRPGRPGARVIRRARAAERRAYRALSRAGFADPLIAAEVLRQVQVMALTPELARLDYTTAGPAYQAIANLISAGPPSGPLPGSLPAAVIPAASSAARDGEPGSSPPVPGTGGRAGPAPVTSAEQPGTGQAAGSGQPPHSGQSGTSTQTAHDQQLVAAASRLIAEAEQHGMRLTQAALGGALRHQGFRLANHRLRWLRATATDHGAAAGAGGSHADGSRPEHGTSALRLLQPVSGDGADRVAAGNHAQLPVLGDGQPQHDRTQPGGP